MKLRLLLTVAATFTLAAEAQAFSAKNGARVNPISGSVFEVIPRTDTSSDAIWCAASDFSRRAAGAPWNQKIYVVSGRGRSVTTGRRTAVQFTLNPTAAGVTPLQGGGLRTGFPVGDSMSVQRANSLCNVIPFFR
ncbi:MAG: hypothetical protein AB3N21_15120 [Ruegeria sp.]|uniref:hypothetical protein n=1 Tax=Ruegeria sp. TaxID=1879320 RepID=UPI00349E835F